MPLTMPSMCGPGTMALVISGAAQIAELPGEYNRLTIYGGMVTAFALMSLISWGVLKLADPVCKILGDTGIDAMTRIMGFLLVCMGMQFCINGIKEVAQDPVFHGGGAVQSTPALPQVSGTFDHLPQKPTSSD